MHPEMNLRLAQLRIDDMNQRARLRRPRRTVRRWRRQDSTPATTAPAPLVHLRPPRPGPAGDAVGGDDRRAA
jgi:hypothetical protein